MLLFDRVTQHPGVTGGRPRTRGMRVAVEMIVVGAGRAIEEVLADYR
jgi:uncharacterized protein (DUF433 family)